MAKKKLRQCRSGKDFINYGAKNGGRIVSAKGSHTKIKTGMGQIIVPQHNKDLGRGLLSKLMKGFISIGITIAVIIVKTH